MSVLTRARIAATATALLAIGALAGCSTVSKDAGAAAPGVTDTTITLGVTGAYTGPLAPSGLADLAGINLYWNDVNAQGGICDGRRVEILARDDVYDPQKTVTAYSGIRDQVLAMQLVTATAPTQALAPLMKKDGIVGFTSSAAPTLLGNDSVLVTGTPYDVEMVNAVDYLLAQGTIARGDSIGYIYFQGDYGASGFEGATFAGERNGITVNPYQIDATVTDVSAQISDIAAKGGKAIFMSASSPLLANAAAVSKTAGLRVPIVVAAPTFAPAVLDTAAGDEIAARTIVASSLNAWSADVPAIAKLRDLYAAGDKSVSPQGYIVQGYGLGLLMRTVLESACSSGDLTREGLAKQLSAIDEFDMQGLQVNVSYADPKLPPASKTYLLKADRSAAGGLVALNSDTPFEGSSAAAFIAKG